ncbi:MAG: CFI-box-CTERM domain-containing protein [Candidatus Nitrosoabyssus spongiisocia]|nr:MAG: CFI-box-CTERM domain-containing protein [Nitrosopumilaceae archaeon AB1(1)]
MNDSRRGDKITLTITYPDGTTNSEILTVTKSGAFQSFIILERNSLKGEYEILASVKNKIIGMTTFTVDSNKESSPTNPSPIPTITPENNLSTSPNFDKKFLPESISNNESSQTNLSSKDTSNLDYKPEIESNTNAGQNTICGKGTTYENGQCIVKSSDMGGCLIATTTYSSELASQVQFLREIRDTTLQSTTSGATFMMSFNQIYYSFSPVISDLERGNPIFADIIKLLITPMLSTLSLITLADLGSELEVMILGMIVIILNLTLYIVGPILIISKLYARVKNFNMSN